MLLAQASSNANPILPATNEAVWSVITIAFAVLAMLAFVLLIRWASFRLGSQIGRLKYRTPKRS
jgi:LPXTG-motif cell wall-anchored protein